MPYIKLTKKKIIIEKHSAFIFLASLLYLGIIIYIAPTKILRYVMPIFPFFIFLPITLINAITNKKLCLSIIALMSLCFMLISFNENNIENIYKTKPEIYRFTKDKQIPVFIKNSTRWKYADLVPYLADDQKYYFIDAFENNISAPYSDLWLITEDNISESQYIDELNIFEVESQFAASYFVCRKLIRKNQHKTE